MQEIGESPGRCGCAGCRRRARPGMLNSSAMPEADQAQFGGRRHRGREQTGHGNAEHDGLAEIAAQRVTEPDPVLLGDRQDRARTQPAARSTSACRRAGRDEHGDRVGRDGAQDDEHHDRHQQHHRDRGQQPLSARSRRARRIMPVLIWLQRIFGRHDVATLDRSRCCSACLWTMREHRLEQRRRPSRAPAASLLSCLVARHARGIVGFGQQVMHALANGRVAPGGERQ